MFSLVTDPKEAEPITLEMFRLFAKSINKIVGKINGTEYISDLRLLDDCKLLLKKVEQIIKDHPKVVLGDNLLEAYNNVIVFKSNYYSLVSQLATNIADEIKIILGKKISVLKSMYGSKNADSTPIDLTELAKRLEIDQYSLILESDTDSSNLFVRGLGQNMREFFREQMERYANSVTGIDLMLNHFKQISLLLGLSAVENTYFIVYSVYLNGVLLWCYTKQLTLILLRASYQSSE